MTNERMNEMIAELTKTETAEFDYAKAVEDSVIETLTALGCEARVRHIKVNGAMGDSRDISNALQRLRRRGLVEAVNAGVKINDKKWRLK